MGNQQFVEIAIVNTTSSPPREELSGQLTGGVSPEKHVIGAIYATRKGSFPEPIDSTAFFGSNQRFKQSKDALDSATKRQTQSVENNA